MPPVVPVLDPVPEPVRTELARVEQRWRQLPLDRAERSAGAVREMVQRLADAVAERRGQDPWPVPDLGPATLMDQLGVMVYDASEVGLLEDLEGQLGDLRRALA